MKRTRKINLETMRKSAKAFPYKKISIAISASILAGCSDDIEQAQVYLSADDCIQQNPEEQSYCETGYQKALVEHIKSGPKYDNMAACIADFGPQNCTSYPVNNSQSIFMPLMAGYMLSSLINNRDYRYAPLYTSYSRRSPAFGRWTSTDGILYGKKGSSNKITVPSDAFKPKPKVKRTMSRGGFGSTIAAKSNFGGKSSRSSWGG